MNKSTCGSRDTSEAMESPSGPSTKKRRFESPNDRLLNSLGKNKTEAMNTATSTSLQPTQNEQYEAPLSHIGSPSSGAYDTAINAASKPPVSGTTSRVSATPNRRHQKKEQVGYDGINGRRSSWERVQDTAEKEISSKGTAMPLYQGTDDHESDQQSRWEAAGMKLIQKQKAVTGHSRDGSSGTSDFSDQYEDAETGDTDSEKSKRGSDTPKAHRVVDGIQHGEPAPDKRSSLRPEGPHIAAKMPPHQIQHTNIGGPSASTYPLNRQSEAMSRQHDYVDAESHFRHAQATSYSSVTNTRDRHSSAAEHYANRTSSLLPRMYPAGRESGSTLSGDRLPSSTIGTRPPLCSTDLRPQEDLYSRATSTESYRDHLCLYYHQLEAEKNRLLAQERSRHLNSFPYGYDALQEQASYGGSYPYSAPGEPNDRIQQLLGSRYAGQLPSVRENVDRMLELNASSPRAADPQLSTLHVPSGEVTSDLNHNVYHSGNHIPSRSSSLEPRPENRSSSERNVAEITAGTPMVVLPRFHDRTESTPHLPPNQGLAATDPPPTPGPDHDGYPGERSPTRVLPPSRAAPVPPPCYEESVPPLSERDVLSLGVDKDKEQSVGLIPFVRSELVGVFRASAKDVISRINTKRIVYHQIGIRCIYCAHLPVNERAPRSMTFPSSTSRLQASIKMMTREHFPKCQEVPVRLKEKLNGLREESDGPAVNYRSQLYWGEIAMQLGLVDTIDGILFQEDVTRINDVGYQMLVGEDDRELVPDYMHFLMSQSKRIHLTEFDSMQRGHSLFPSGMAGFGCRYCAELPPNNPLQLPGRFFAKKAKNLPAKADVFLNHLEACSRCPPDVKESMIRLKRNAKLNGVTLAGESEERTKTFFHRIFVRMHGKIPVGVPIARPREEMEGDALGLPS